MPMNKQSSDQIPRKSRGRVKPVRPEDDDLADTLETVDDAQERGNGLETSKAIARGGKSTGHVPGAMPDTGK